MEKLPKDVLINEIFPKLPSDDILNLCRKSRQLSELCVSEKANTLWIKRIKEEFNVDYLEPDAIFEYLSLKDKNVWIVHEVYGEFKDYYLDNTRIFKKFNDAVKYVKNNNNRANLRRDRDNLIKSSEGYYSLGSFMIRPFKLE